MDSKEILRRTLRDLILEQRIAIIESLKHWFRMRRYVRKLIKQTGGRTKIDYMRMLVNLGETWSDKWCALCKLYIGDHNPISTCDNCPLAKKYESCNLTISIWNKVNQSTNWIEWYKNSKEMIRALWSLF